jgi:hydroxymethylpyrimidine/phosphomethylpyrimidine kinase
MTAITSITAQNTRGVHRVDPVPVEGLVAQLEAVFDDLPVGAVKVGMLGTAEHVVALTDLLAGLQPIPAVVLDPVMVSSTGHRLLDADAEDALRRLAPLCALITPNLPEAAVLAGSDDLRDQHRWAAEQPFAVLLTGGDTDADEVIDTLYRPGWPPRAWRAPRLGSSSFHGTGCTLSSAIAARLAHGRDLEDAVDGAIGYVQALIRAGLELGSPGGGHPVLPHGLD